MMIDELDIWVEEFGEEHLDLIDKALDWLKAREDLLGDVDRRKYIEDAIKRANKKTG